MALLDFFFSISSTVVMRFSCTDFGCNKTVGQLNLLIVRTESLLV